jgi:MOSC domain-containing protein YiiM
MPHVVSLAYKPAEVESQPAERFARVAVERVVLIADHGITGDAKGGSGNRQLNVMLAEMVERMRAEGCRTAPGELGEQVVVAGLSGDALTLGTRLRLGDSAIVELVKDREPCGRLTAVQRQTKDVFLGRLGFMARVLMDGAVAVGDPVIVEQLSAKLA